MHLIMITIIIINQLVYIFPIFLALKTHVPHVQQRSVKLLPQYSKICLIHAELSKLQSKYIFPSYPSMHGAWCVTKINARPTDINVQTLSTTSVRVGGSGSLYDPVSSNFSWYMIDVALHSLVQSSVRQAHGHYYPPWKPVRDVNTLAASII